MAANHYYVVDQIEKALYALMKEKDYADITVTDIVKRASGTNTASMPGAA